MRFRSKVELGGKTATGFEIPEKVVVGLGSHKRPAVRITINGHTYRTTVAPMGGRFMIPLSATNREGAGVEAGDAISVDVELDTQPREVTVPKDLAAALRRDPKAGRAFEALSFSRKQQHVLSVEGAKTDETRRRRIAKAVDALRRAP